MNSALIALIAQLAQSGITVYQQMHAASTAPNPDLAKVAALLPTAANVYAALQQAGDVLQRAQAEAWADDDVRWGPVFADADKALVDAEARLA